MNEFFLALRGKTLIKDKLLMLANDLFLTHRAFYTFLGIHYIHFKKKEHKEILMDELGLSERGRTEKYGKINHADLWLKDLNVERSELSLDSTFSVKIFEKLCLDACEDEQKGEALIAAIESIAYDFVFELGSALKNSGYTELISVDIHCNSEYGIETEHAFETEKFSNNPFFKEYQKQVTLSFLGLAAYFS